MLTFEQIKELIELVATHRLSGVELERSGFRLKVEGQKVGKPAHPGATVAEPAVESPPEPRVSPAPAAGAEGPAEAEGHVLKSPIVGTFYRRPNPEANPYAEVGDRVKTGQILCIVEAMKLMNEIESDVDGVIVEIFPKNGQPVEFGEPLFVINPS